MAMRNRFQDEGGEDSREEPRDSPQSFLHGAERTRSPHEQGSDERPLHHHDETPTNRLRRWLPAARPRNRLTDMDTIPRIVAIDDEVEFTKTIHQFFSARGYQVHIALTGSSGLELVELHQPQVVLVDLKLPGMDGDELLQRVRRSLPKTQVIVITAYNDGGKTRDRLLSLGAFAHFDKPLSSLRDLADAIKRALASPPPQPPLETPHASRS